MIYFMFSLALALNSNCDFFKSNSGWSVDVQPLNGFQNSAGFDLKSCEQRLVFDFGFSRGGMGVTSIPTGTVIIKDSSGHQCRMINQQLVDYAKKNADPSFPSNTELKKRLKSYCSDLDLSPLDNQPRRLSDQKSNAAS